MSHVRRPGRVAAGRPAPDEPQIHAILSGAPWRETGATDSWLRWRAKLPRLVESVLADWGLRLEGVRGFGECAVVLGVRTSEGIAAAAKFGWPHPESEHEHLALGLWGGHGAVRLLRADPARGVLLLERAGPSDLATVDVRTACSVVGELYARLHRPAAPQFDRLSVRCRRWCRQLAALPAGGPVPRRLVQQATALATDFASDPATDARLLHGDLHYANVLEADRVPWLAIDPKPLSGDPCFEVAPMLWNRWGEAVGSGNVRNAMRERMFDVAGAGGLDVDRVRDWVIVRELVNVMWTLHDGPPAGLQDREWITRSVTIAKAVQG